MIGLILFVLAVVALLLWLNLRRHQTALTEGEIVYEAAGTTRIDEALVSPRYKLVGRPDYVVRMPQGLVPVEVKSRSCCKGPHDSESQLFAYCLLVEEKMGAPVRSGILRYADRDLTVSFGERERAWVLGLLEQMQQSRNFRDVARSHSHERRCQRCGVRANCGQALV
jgi:CRISPR/Cas system-associated exonuclease Cas4 (RecB family)